MAQKGIAHQLAETHREISVAEFFEKNRHLLGFDNKRKALLTTIKEAVDNSLDAAEEAGILPEINIEVIDLGNERFRVIVEDNGPGIVKKNVPKIFAKLLYGSKFHSMKMSRGQQGIGISAAAMYGQLTTGKPIKIISKIEEEDEARYFELMINTQTNQPEIIKESTTAYSYEHGTRIELDLEGSYMKGDQSIDEYLKETAIVNPHVTIIYVNPKAEQQIYTRVSDTLPPQPKEIKPHPYGIEVGILVKMLKQTKEKWLLSFLQKEFSRVTNAVAMEICKKAVVNPKEKPKNISVNQANDLMKAIREVKIRAPPTDCVFPIGSDLLEKSLKNEINAEFFTSVTRPPSVYRGNPFVIECALAYGGALSSEGSAVLLRFANRVPLLYQQSGGAIAKAVHQTNWRSYGLSQSGGGLPQGPIVILVHIASVWAPFTSEAKEAIAHYPEIIKEMRLALQEAGRKLGQYVKKKHKVADELKKRDFIKKYIPIVGDALDKLLGLNKTEKMIIEENLISILSKERKALKQEIVEAIKAPKEEKQETLLGHTSKFKEHDEESEDEKGEDEKGETGKKKKEEKKNSKGEKQ